MKVSAQVSLLLAGLCLLGALGSFVNHNAEGTSAFADLGSLFALLGIGLLLLLRERDRL